MKTLYSLARCREMPSCTAKMKVVSTMSQMPRRVF